MKKTSKTYQAAAPKRQLRADFTALALRRAAAAQHRASRKQRLLTAKQDLTNMKVVKLMRTVPGAALGLAVVATGSVGVYALTNWFGGNVNVTQKDSSIFNIDLSACKDVQIPGVDQASDRHNVQFKILGSPHVDAQTLQQDLLGMCENYAVRQFYASKYPEANFNNAKTTLTVGDPALQYMLIPASVVQVNDGAIVLRYSLGKGKATETQKAVSLANDVTVFDASQTVALHDLKPGNKIMAVIYSAGATSGSIEGTSILDNANVQIKSLFKTQYNDAYDGSTYEQYNIMPLDMYNQMHQK